VPLSVVPLPVGSEVQAQISPRNRREAEGYRRPSSDTVRLHRGKGPWPDGARSALQPRRTWRGEHEGRSPGCWINRDIASSQSRSSS